MIRQDIIPVTFAEICKLGMVYMDQLNQCEILPESAAKVILRNIKGDITPVYVDKQARFVCGILLEKGNTQTFVGFNELNELGPTFDLKLEMSDTLELTQVRSIRPLSMLGEYKHEYFKAVMRNRMVLDICEGISLMKDLEVNIGKFKDLSKLEKDLDYIGASQCLITKDLKCVGILITLDSNYEDSDYIDVVYSSITRFVVDIENIILYKFMCDTDKIRLIIA